MNLEVAETIVTVSQRYGVHIESCAKNRNIDLLDWWGKVVDRIPEEHLRGLEKSPLVDEDDPSSIAGRMHQIVEAKVRVI